MKRSKILPLSSIHFQTRPLAHHALAWSCDAELAVAADDSVHILVPEFPDPRDDTRPADASATRSKRQGKRVLKRKRGDNSSAEETSEDDSGSDEESDEVNGWNLGLATGLTQRRQQFARGRKHFPVSSPPVDPRVNRELFEAAGMDFAYDAFEEDEDGDAGYGGVDENLDEADDDVWIPESRDDKANPHSDASYITHGAGQGPISGAGGTMNHVVALEWSPSGIGRNRRPVLAVLTASGVLAVYGDGPSSTGIQFLRIGGEGQRRDLDSWILLWGVGERLFVPGQNAEVAEHIRSFSWSGEVGPGQVLLAYTNDQREVVVLSVQSRWDVVRGEAGLEKGAANWHVHEVARVKAEGPHPILSPWDADFVPSGSPYGLKWSPWLVQGNSRTSMLAFIDQNYVGFRRITIEKEWQSGELPTLTLAEKDCDGQCLFLSTDAFVEWEDAVWTIGDSKICRGTIATPYHAKSFQVALAAPGSTYEVSSHPTSVCKTTYSDLTIDPESTNPVVGLVIHPPGLAKRPGSPLYTLIRMSATSTNDDWYQTNATFPASPSRSSPVNDQANGSTPKWALEIQEKLDLRVPAGFEDDFLPSASGSGSDSSDNEDSDLNLEDADADPDSDGGGEGKPSFTDSMVHPHRFRLHGLAASPAGGTSAVLASMFSTQTADRGGWHTLRSTLFFSPRSHKSAKPPEDAGRTSAAAPERFRSAKLTTEAKMWEWMYGGGTGVPGITKGSKGTEVEESGDGKVKELFKEISGARDCDVCGVPLVARGRAGQEGLCPRGHIFDLCGASGIAIQAPGVSKTCGVCGSRCMKVDELVRLAPQHEEIIRKLVSGELCGSCGGKFLD